MTDRSSRTIEVLPDAVANQIAAGEVVERPASVVKELVENALDAAASTIEIEVDRGGKRRIRVVDDGRGMGREDALLSVDRHATSKIRLARDLRDIATFGFRGEALPSIAAVSRMTVATRNGGSDVATILRIEGGRLVGVDETTRRRGTTVEVNNLFFNAPARGKFLKSVSAETRAVSDTLTVLALANPAVGFTLTSGDRMLLELAPSDDVVDRIAAIWGRDAAATLLPIEADGEGFRLRGLIQRPDDAGPGFRRAHLFVNRRPFREAALLKAADRGYRTTIAQKIRPWIFLYIEADPGGVDVNVHPAKAEVRFRDRAALESLVEQAVAATLRERASGASFERITSASLRVREPEPTARPAPVEDAQTALFMAGDASAVGSLEADVAEGGTPPALVERPRLWQALNMYLLAETREGLLIIDQHSAQERVLFQKLMGDFEAGSEDSQKLLFPLTIRLSPAEIEQVESLSRMLAQVGFEVESFGGNTVIVHAVPNPHPQFDAARCFREMIAELTEGSELMRSGKNQHERIAMTFACKGAIKAGQRLDEAEMQELFDRLFATDLPYHDVHGRPTIVRLSAAELERKFGR
ncbi:MAG: DNA mismatch repair endonuclease MutL [Gemmatimonadota bacterium]|nr:MAG: DNA mismatch repair endonuclease MutL [Gemmatimonadota bacterium]